MKDCHLLELPVVGRSYTWTNGHVYNRINNAIVNTPWLVAMPAVQVLAMDSMFLYHSPLSINLEEQTYVRKNPFKFYNCLA